jgi:hypothetical protein
MTNDEIIAVGNLIRTLSLARHSLFVIGISTVPQDRQ